MRERRLRAGIGLLGMGNLGLGAWQAVSPGSFFRTLGGFGAENEHYIRDSATLYAALGVVLLVAASKAPWRPPVLFFALLQGVLHLANHVADAGSSHPGWTGPLDVVLLAGTALVFGVALVESGRIARGSGPGSGTPARGAG